MRACSSDWLPNANLVINYSQRIWSISSVFKTCPYTLTYAMLGYIVKCVWSLRGAAVAWWTATRRPGVRFLVGTVYLASFASFARDSNWGTVSKWHHCWRDVKHKQTNRQVWLHVSTSVLRQRSYDRKTCHPFVGNFPTSYRYIFKKFSIS